MIELLKILKSTQSAAISCYNFIGKGNEKLADKAAVDAMRESLNQMDFKARIVIGEGERDEAPMLYIGEEVGLLRETTSPIQFDIAVDPLEGTTICANNAPGSLAVLAISEFNGMLHAPDVYMNKIASYIPSEEQVIDLDESIINNLKNISLYKKTPINELNITILNRPRHEEIIAKIRESGSRLKLIDDGDIAAVIEVAMKQSDLYLGIGGAPEGVLAAAALKTLSGQFMGRLIFKDETEKNRAKKLGIEDLNKKYHLKELVSKNAVMCLTGVTSGTLLNGVQKTKDSYITNSIILSSFSKEFLKIESNHSL